MEEQCMIMCGEWVCGDDGKWDFLIDKQRMARFVTLYDGIGLLELQGNVLREFGVEDGLFAAALSCWSSSSLDLATGLQTPPVLITSDGAIKYFLQQLRARGTMNMFVKFERKTTQEGIIDDSGMGFVTPASFRTSGFSQACSVTASRGFGSAPGSRSLGSGSVSRALGTMSRGFGPRTASSGKTTLEVPPPVVNLEDVEFVKEVERAEEEIKERNDYRKEETLGGSVVFEDDVGKVVSEVDDRDVRPRGYDQVFWTPLLKSDYAGSNAVKVVYNEDEIVDDLLKKRRPSRYTCPSNDDVDPVFDVGGPSSVKNNGGGDKHPWMGRDNPWISRVNDSPSVVMMPPVKPRKLDEVDDEEFDIPPLFDDTSYAAAEIPDMDLEEADGRIYVGKVFGNKEDCQISLAIYAIRNQFRFKQTRTKIDSFVVSCPDPKCDWRVTAHEMRGCGYYEIRKAQLEHRCPIDFRQGYQSRATSKVIAAVYKSKFGEPGKGPVPRELQKLVLEDLRVSASYMKCYRATEMAAIDILGTEEESYLKLPQYLHMLKLANPGTVADLETEVDDDGDERFLYLFLSFGASISGFKKLRLVLVIDGTHLGGKYKGVLLTASGQDANFQIFPLAYAIVDAEDEESWTWFLMKLERILADSPKLAIISDRAVCIGTAVKRVYPRANHGYCIVHLARNVNSRYSSKNLAQLVTATGMAYRQRDYRDLYSKVRAQRSECGVYFGNIGVAHWTRANFLGDRYNMMTSNIAEQLNHALVEGRSSPIMELVIFIQRMMTRWFSARRNKAEKHRGMVSVEVDKQMTKNMATMSGSKVNSSTEWRCEIIGKYGGKERVNLVDKQCDCKYFDKLKIPCGHALLAADSLGVPYESLVGHCYKTTTWRETYEGVISPEGDPRDVDVPEDVMNLVLRPPVTKRQPGRRRKNRQLSTGEFPVLRRQSW
ncbi:uncharacterized protein LOC130497765 isoform X2 [Raphanus sativus]|uniref:Uncharacterized protein LOC130497765 isoform X2 n=1 Tax=Raphanus sativus TaxID=3726 RepID=A0A9W3C5Y4_RAPSA|nr:uncharacterized protein LOC130497765 isoform X2 [Raphanus sativus]